MGNSTTTRTARSQPLSMRRLVTPLPYLALAIVLGATIWLALQRNAELEAEQRETDANARKEFIDQLDIGAARTETEVDRLTELMTGIRAFATSYQTADADAVADYLLLTGATERFPAMVAAVVVPVVDGVTTPSERSTVTVDDPQGRIVPVEMAGATDAQLIDDVNARLASDDGAFLSQTVWDGTPKTALVFPLASDFLAAESTSWVALLFDVDSFGVTTSPTLANNITTTVVVTDLPYDPATADQPPEVFATPTGRLVGERHIDMFGTTFMLQAESSPGFVGTVARGQVYMLLGAGAVAALGLYAALRGLVEARARAIETARTATAARAAVDRRFRTSFESSPIGMAEIDTLGRLVEVNEAMCDQIGATRDDVLGRTLSSLVHEPDRPHHLQRIERLLDGGGDANQGEHRFHRTDGTDIWVSESISVIESDANGPLAMLVQSQDITAQRRAAWELAQQALHDDLTGLPNRVLFLNRIKHALDRCERTGSQLAVMFIDIDRFKVINDSLGHDMGDAFLVQIAERIGTALRTGDTVARFGGDEFVVLCEEVAGESEALAVAQRIQSSFAEPFLLGDTPTYATSSIGITLTTDVEETAESLLRDADAAMYRAKESGRNRTELFDHSMRSTVVARMEIESQLRAALENGEMVMHYMAIVDPHTYQPAGYEALIRWNHPEKGLLGPGAFLDVAEEAGLIHLVDSFALRQTCHQAAAWIAQYPAAKDVYIATNWSARHLGRFVQQVEQVLDETGIDPCHLVIEVTEGFLLQDTDGSLVALEQLKDLGVRIAIDDFGTGYSSLAYLTRFDVDFLKIDQSFVSKLPEDEASAAVIGAIADMATRLGIGLVAEGVETDEQIKMLSSLGSPRLQGYRFARPRPASDIEYQLEMRSRQMTAINASLAELVGD